jgi:hypothetical protein
MILSKQLPEFSKTCIKGFHYAVEDLRNSPIKNFEYYHGHRFMDLIHND